MSTETDRLAVNFTALAEAIADLERTILAGWPFDDAPSDIEAQQIEAAHHEVLMHRPDFGDTHAWVLAGQIVARFRRDVEGAPDGP